mmetsp:Transcript_26948/g.69303  ORF Transcript_26948/g.69303 Transcript_26948/m.69303 type:complete len:119 (-) Transcript_26948:934-1290(-)
MVKFGRGCSNHMRESVVVLSITRVIAFFFCNCLTNSQGEALVQIRKRDRRGACEAFEKLWLKGVWLTSGKRYGADFAVYAGDPLVYHAEALVKLDGIDGEGVLERVAQHAGKSLLDIE